IRIRGRSSLVSTATRGPFKIGENELVVPTNRVFIYGNYYSGVGHDVGESRFDVYRNVFGFEAAFLDGNASVGVRAGWQQATNGVPGIDGFSDVTVVGKFALLNDRESGNIVTGGLSITLPFGVSPTLADGRKLSPVLLQPWLGGLVTAGNAYAQAFT